MGRTICHDLLTSNPNHVVVGYDRAKAARNQAETRFASFGERFSTSVLTLSIEEKPENHSLNDKFRLANINVVFGAIDYKFNLFLSKICLAAECSFVDLGGNPSVVQAQRALHHEAQDAKVVIIPDLGLAPGMVNIIAAAKMKDFEILNDCHLRVGGLPQEPRTLLKYQRVFSIRGLTNEYLEDAVIIRDGKRTIVPSLTGTESLSFPEPWGNLEAFHTGGGSGGLPYLLEGKIQNLTYKTIRFPGHVQYFVLMKELGLFSSQFPPNPTISPRNIVEYGLERYLPRNAPDAVLVRITINGIKRGEKQTNTYQLIDLLDPVTGHSAMARTTAYPTSIIGQYIAKGTIANPGVQYAEEVVPIDAFQADLEQRRIQFERKATE